MLKYSRFFFLIGLLTTTGCFYTVDEAFAPSPDQESNAILNSQQVPTPKAPEKKEIENVEFNRSKSEEFYYWAASQGYSRAQYLYGIFLKEQNRTEESLIWLQRAANQGDRDAIMQLAQDKSNEKTSEAYIQALEILHPLLKQTYPEALLLAADIEVQQHHVDMAKMYLKEAAALGNLTAKARLVSILSQQDEQAFQMAQRAMDDLEENSLLPEYTERQKYIPINIQQNLISGLESPEKESSALLKEYIVLKDFFKIVDQAAEKGSPYAALAEARARLELPSLTPPSQISLTTLVNTASSLVPGQVMKARLIFQKRIPGNTQDAWKSLESAAQSHDPYALFALSARERAAQNYDRALQYYQEGLIQKNFADALAQWAIDLLAGLFPFHQQESAYDALYYLAASHHPKALMALADAKESGAISGTPEEIFTFRYQAAWQGVPKAQYYVANAYLKGSGVELNPNRAFRWFLQSARSGYRPAQYQVSYLYEKGHGTYPSITKAYAWKVVALQGLFEDNKTHGQELVNQMTWDQLNSARVLAHAYEAQYYRPGQV
ncbi:MAG: sel1 repeat family protein [Gammaproteobacteria bacterium]|nr:sel1 repeat family protein [Gammaproteobacteria bacterium]